VRFKALDGWRGVCALMVALHNFEYSQASSFVNNSALFVDFFFVLSGFVISHAYMLKLENHFDLGAFLLRRLGRLWPLHVVLLVVFVALDVLKIIIDSFLHPGFEVLPFQGPNSVGAIVRNLLLIQAVGIHTQISWNVPSWSISTEFWTYLVFSLACITSPRLPPAFVLTGAIALLAGGVIFLFSPNFLETNTEYAVFRCLYGFFIGHLIYRAWDATKDKLQIGGPIEILTIILVAGFVFICTDVMSMAAPIVFGFAVWVFAHENGVISKLLMTRPFVQLGLWSYSIYMVHWLIRDIMSGTVKIGSALLKGHAINAAFSWNGIDKAIAMDVVIIGYLVAVVAISAMTHRFIEQPGRKYFNRISENLRPKV
jgi:peptidoglycan/LPS O-acetylase OafA/YrhL